MTERIRLDNQTVDGTLTPAKISTNPLDNFTFPGNVTIAGAVSAASGTGGGSGTMIVAALAVNGTANGAVNGTPSETSTVLFTPTIPGNYRVSIYIMGTNGSDFNDTVNPYLDWTDATFAQSTGFTGQGSGTNVTLSNPLTPGLFLAAELEVYSVAGQPITYRVNFSTTATNPVDATGTYTTYIVVEQLTEVGGGGGGSPAAPDTSIQFNNGGSFGGDAAFYYDPTGYPYAGGTVHVPNLIINSILGYNTDLVLALYPSGPDPISNNSIVMISRTTNALPTADHTALLDMQSTTQGFLPPRMTTAQRNAISQAATGQVYAFDFTQLQGATVGVNGVILTQNVDWFTGGEANDTTATVPCIITGVSGTIGGTITINSTVGMSATDAFVQGTANTTITTVVDGQNLIVADATGFVAGDGTTTATSIAAAITAATGTTLATAVQGPYVVGLSITANTVGSSGNSIALTTSDQANLTPSGPTLSAGISAATALMIFNTDTNQPEVFNGTSWVGISGSFTPTVMAEFGGAAGATTTDFEDISTGGVDFAMADPSHRVKVTYYSGMGYVGQPTSNLIGRLRMDTTYSDTLIWAGNSDFVVPYSMTYIFSPGDTASHHYHVQHCVQATPNTSVLANGKQTYIVEEII